MSTYTPITLLYVNWGWVRSLFCLRVDSRVVVAYDIKNYRTIDGEYLPDGTASNWTLYRAIVSWSLGTLSSPEVIIWGSSNMVRACQPAHLVICHPGRSIGCPACTIDMHRMHHQLDNAFRGEVGAWGAKYDSDSDCSPYLNVNPSMEEFIYIEQLSLLPPSSN